MIFGYVGADKGSDAGDPVLREHDIRGIEVQEHISGGDNDLSAA
jgi:hypothetical protein